MAQEKIGDNETVSAMARMLAEGRTRSIQVGGRVVEFHEAKMKHIPLLVGLFNEIVQSVDQKSITTLVSMIATRQITAIKSGQNPDDIPMPEEALVMQAFGNIDILQHITVSVSGTLPKMASALSTLSEDEYNELSIDEGIAVLYGIFVLNYGFFTERLVPTLRVLLGAAMSKKSASQPQNAANA